MNGITLTPRGKAMLEANTMQGVLFDMDGVLIDTERLYTRFWIEAGRYFGFPMTVEHALGLRSLSHALARQRFVDWFGPAASHSEIRKKRIELMNAYLEEHGVELKRGVLELLDHLEENRIPFCIATASSEEVARKHLGRLGLNDRFAYIVTAYDVTNGKPAPDIYLAAAEKIGVPIDCCIAVEDSFNGIRSASSAGAITIMVPDQDQPDEEMWSLISGKAESLEQLITLFSISKS